MLKEVDEVRNLREEVLFLERIAHGCIVLQRTGWRGSIRHRQGQVPSRFFLEDSGSIWTGPKHGAPDLSGHPCGGLDVRGKAGPFSPRVLEFLDGSELLISPAIKLV